MGVFLLRGDPREDACHRAAVKRGPRVRRVRDRGRPPGLRPPGLVRERRRHRPASRSRREDCRGFGRRRRRFRGRGRRRRSNVLLGRRPDDSAPLPMLPSHVVHVVHRAFLCEVPVLFRSLHRPGGGVRGSAPWRRRCAREPSARRGRWAIRRRALASASGGLGATYPGSSASLATRSRPRAQL